MMRQASEHRARRAPDENGAPVVRLRPNAGPHGEGLGQDLADRALPARGRTSSVVQIGTEALHLVDDVAVAVRDAEARLQEEETRGQVLVERTLQQLKHADLQKQELEQELQSAEVRCQLMEARLKENEARARQAEEWLARLHDSIFDKLSNDPEGERPQRADSRR